MKVIEGNQTNFEEEVLKSDQKVLVDFNAEWSGPCKMLKPIVEEIAEARDDIKVVSVNIDDEDVLAETYGVFSIPCLVVFEKGKEVKRNVGFMPKEAVEELIGE